MKVTGSNHVSKAINFLLNKVSKSDIGLKSPIVSAKANNSGAGLNVSENPQITYLVKKFDDVPPFEYNKNQTTLELDGASLIGQNDEVMAEI